MPDEFSMTVTQKFRILYWGIFIFISVGITIILFYSFGSWGDLKEKVVTQALEVTKTHLTFLRNINGKENVIFDGKDLGDTVNDIDMVVKEKMPEYTVCNSCWLPIVDRKDIVFMRYIGDKLHIIYNGVDHGEGSYPQISLGHIAFYKMVDGEIHIIFDGKDLGVGRDMILRDGHIAFLRSTRISDPFSSLGTRLVVEAIRDGESVAFGVSNIALSGDNYALLISYGGSFRPKDYPDSSQSILDMTSQHVIFNGSDMGSGDNIVFLNDHLVFYRFVGSDRHAILDGKDLGAGELLISGDNIILTKLVEVDGRSMYNVFSNGKDLGESTIEPIVEGNNIVFLRLVGDSLHIIYNGQDIGEGEKPTLGDGHIAFARRLEASGIFAMQRKLIYDGEVFNKNNPDGEDIIDIRLIDNDVVYITRRCEPSTVECKSYVMYNGKDLGEGHDPILSKD